jgi:putative transposase
VALNAVERKGGSSRLACAAQSADWRGRLALNLRFKSRKRIVRAKLQPLAVPDSINECWSMDFIQAGNPQQNGYIERYNRTVRYDGLGRYLFVSIEGVQDRTTGWLWTYDNERNNMAIGGIIHEMRLVLAVQDTTFDVG